METHRDHPQRPPADTCGDHISQSFALPPPPNQSVFHLPCPLEPNQSVICLAPCHQATCRDQWRPPTETHEDHISQSFALPPATKPVSHSFALPPATKPPTESRRDHLWRPPTETTHGDHTQRPMETCKDHPWRPMETTCRDHSWRPSETCRDHISQSFALPPATKPVSNSFACPLPPNQSVICLAPCHQMTHGDPWRPHTETTHGNPRRPMETHGDHLQRPPMETH